jgi:hypothetical protein
MKKNICTALFSIFFAIPAVPGQTATSDSDRNIVPFPNTPNDMRAPPRTRGRTVMQSGRPDPRTLPPIVAEQMAAIAEASAENSKYIPPMEYIRKYYLYSTSPWMGLARIFPDKNCGTGGTVTLAELERCADVPQKGRGGSLYSFRAGYGLSSLRKNGWIMRFANGKFEVGNDIVQALMADLGDVDIEAVGLEHKAFEFLSDYGPKQKREAIVEQREVLAAGIKGEGYTFTNAVPVNLGSTYALRAIIYRYHEDGAPLPDRGFDQYVVFKVVGIERDGSVIIIWKELARDYPRRKIEN